MKKFFLTLAIAGFLTTTIFAQTRLPLVDKSPMDMSYCPNGYPVAKIQDKITDPLLARVVYSRPQKNSRNIFGGLVEYGKVWRLGANEATEIEFFHPVRINDRRVKKGRYTMYCIPYPDKWTLIINKETDTWGSFKYNEKRDIVRVDVPVQRSDNLDSFAMVFEKTSSGYNLVIAWDDLKVSMPIVY